MKIRFAIPFLMLMVLLLVPQSAKAYNPGPVIALIFVPFLIFFTPVVGFSTGYVFRILKFEKPKKKSELIPALAILWLLWIAVLTLTPYLIFTISPITISEITVYLIFGFLIAYRKWNWKKIIIAFLSISLIVFSLAVSI